MLEVYSKFEMRSSSSRSKIHPVSSEPRYRNRFTDTRGHFTNIYAFL